MQIDFSSFFNGVEWVQCQRKTASNEAYFGLSLPRRGRPGSALTGCILSFELTEAS